MSAHTVPGGIPRHNEPQSFHIPPAASQFVWVNADEVDVGTTGCGIGNTIGTFGGGRAAGGFTGKANARTMIASAIANTQIPKSA